MNVKFTDNRKEVLAQLEAACLRALARQKTMSVSTEFGKTETTDLRQRTQTAEAIRAKETEKSTAKRR